MRRRRRHPEKLVCMWRSARRQRAAPEVGTSIIRGSLYPRPSGGQGVRPAARDRPPPPPAAAPDAYNPAHDQEGQGRAVTRSPRTAEARLGAAATTGPPLLAGERLSKTYRLG